MNWDRFDAVQLGRLTGIVIVVGGILYSAWTALDQPEGFPRNSSAQIFVREALYWAFSGVMLILVAELADRLGWGRQPVDEELGVEAADDPAEPVA
jgi:hypothetical protein